MKISLFEIITLSADAGLKIQSKDGSMPAGHNGYYKDPETPARNTSHWLITFLKAYEISREVRFLNSAELALGYLMSDKARPMGATFWHRLNPKKDFVNGLMGQAWTIEALIYANKFFKEPEILQLCEKVFLLHPYDAKLNGWKRVNVDGSNSTFDMTFNHQLWFAAVGSLLIEAGIESVTGTVKNFLSSIEKNIQLYRNGIIMHLPPYYLRNSNFSKLKGLLQQEVISGNKDQQYVYDKSVGYHGFNLYALAIIHQVYPDLPFFSSKKFDRIMKVISTNKFVDELAKSKYGYPYNPPGLELGYGLQEFGKLEQIEFFLQEHFKTTFNFTTAKMSANDPPDIATSEARIYEAYRLNNYEINL